MSGRGEPDAGDGEGPGRAPRANPRGRVQLRAAVALEEAGELEEAARLFEHVGEHAQAASLRLEHARSLPDEHHRLIVLREGAARNGGDTEQGAALHRGLAGALLGQVEAMPDGGQRRALLVEAAHALEEAGDAEEAGGIYEGLGMLTRAAGSYERAGAIGKLELVLTVLERREQAEQALWQLERDVEEAWRDGKRGVARTLMTEHVRDAERRRRPPVLGLVRRLGELQRALPRPGALHLKYSTDGGGDRVVHVYLGDQLRIGRGPDCEVRVTGSALSREHVILRADHDEQGRPIVSAIDQGARAGTFWAGETLIPGVGCPLEAAAELGLGISTTIEVVPIPSRVGVTGALVGGADRDWSLFLPHGGPLLLDPGRLAPAMIEARGTFSTLRCSGAVDTWLDDRPLGRAAVLELLLHDRVRFESGGEPTLRLEVLG